MIKSPRDVIVRPIVSEKSYAGIEHNTYTFLVDPRANKTEIKEAVQSIWDVRVLSVNTLKRTGEDEAARVHARPPSRREARGRDARPGRQHRDLRRREYVTVAVRKYKPTTPGRRGASVSSFDEITRSTPEKSLLAKGRKKAGRNVHGRITTRHQGGGTKRRYRLIDFRRNKDDIPAKVATIEYDPNRSSRIALLHYADGEKRYILAPDGVVVGDMLMSGEGAEIRPGNALPLRNIPVGTVIHAVEMKPGAGARMARSAGTSVQLMAKEGKLATLRLPSGEMRTVPSTCKGTVGVVGNPEHELISLGKAGRNRWKGKRPIGARRRDEPGRSPARRRRRQGVGRPASDLAVGEEGRPHQEEEEGVEQADHPASWEGTWLMARSVKKGPFVDEHLMVKIAGMNERGEKKVVKTWSRRSDDRAGHDRTHDRGPRRSQARPRVRVGVDGRAQARRVRSDAYVPHALEGRTEDGTQVDGSSSDGQIHPHVAAEDAARGRPHPRAARGGGTTHPPAVHPRRVA